MNVLDIVTVGFLRLVTNPRVVGHPSDLDDAFGFLSSLRAAGVALPPSQTASFMALFQQLATNGRARANLVHDAYIAAVAVALGGTVVTFDRDFRRFDGVRLLERPTA